MNWLSQMLHTQIDLRKMYPAEKPRRNPNLDKGAEARMVQARKPILNALKKRPLTTRQVMEATGRGDTSTTRRLLNILLEEGVITRSKGRPALWQVRKSV